MALNHCYTCKSIIFPAGQKQEPSPPYFSGTIPRAFPWLNCAGQTPPPRPCWLSLVRRSAARTELRVLARGISAHTWLPLTQTPPQTNQEFSLGHPGPTSPHHSPWINANFSSFKKLSLCVCYKKKPLLLITRKIGTGRA